MKNKTRDPSVVDRSIDAVADGREEGMTIEVDE
jgi:hypothetical protein